MQTHEVRPQQQRGSTRGLREEKKKPCMQASRKKVMRARTTSCARHRSGQDVDSPARYADSLFPTEKRRRPPASDPSVAPDGADAGRGGGAPRKRSQRYAENGLCRGEERGHGAVTKERVGVDVVVVVVVVGDRLFIRPSRPWQHHPTCWAATRRRPTPRPCA